jgi:dynein heavy chain
MSGGHISDDRDRRLCKTYRESFDKDEFKDSALRKFPDESPHFFGMPPNAEIGSLTTQTDFRFETLMNVQPGVTGGDDGDASMEKSVKKTLDEILTNVSDKFNITELYNRREARAVRLDLSPGVRVDEFIHDRDKAVAHRARHSARWRTDSQ